MIFEFREFDIFLKVWNLEVVCWGFLSFDCVQLSYREEVALHKETARQTWS